MPSSTRSRRRSPPVSTGFHGRGFHWRVVFGLGIVWILDGLEVTIVGFLAPTLVSGGSGIDFTNSDVAAAQSIYVAGACLGALLFGQLTDRFGRKKLFLITFGLYLCATVLTAVSWSAWWFLAMRFFTGAGIGGEYSAINSAIDELIPARARGRTDLIINGSFWVGAALGGLASIVLLKESLFALNVGWRLAFAIGATLGLGILFLRRTLPESPRWLFIHGREQEAERIVDQIETEVRESTDQQLPEAEESITVRQRRRIPWRDIARTAFRTYPKRAVLGLSLFVGQAFIYNAVTVTLGITLTTYFGVGANKVGLFYAVFAAGNFMGPLLLGRLFDTVGRRPMIAGTYLLSALMLGGVAVLFGGCAPTSCQGQFTDWELTLALAGTFFFASAGSELRLPHRERGLPDGDPRSGDRLLLRDRDGHRRHHGSAGVRAPGIGQHERGRDRLPHRRGGHGLRRRRRAVPRGPRRAATAWRTSPSRSPPRRPSARGRGARRLPPRRRRSAAIALVRNASEGACADTGPAPVRLPSRPSSGSRPTSARSGSTTRSRSSRGPFRSTASSVATS